MRNLLSSDLKRMFKDKLFLIACIIGAGLALLTTLLYFGLNSLLSAVGEESFVIFYAKDILGASFAPLSNFGLALPIFICIIINKDFSYGTVRNKIICGHSRISIYISLLISTIILMSICIFGYVLVGFGLSSLLLEYSAITTFVNDIGYICLTILFGLIGYILLACIIVFFSTVMKNIGLAIVTYFGFSFLLTILATVLSIGSSFMPANNEVLITIMEVLSNINIFYLFSNVIGYVESYSIANILYIILDVIILGSLVTFLGIILFKKKDLK